jgi:F-type H+-transporting ATPase subunit delta
MAEAVTQARPYAEAVFRLADDGGTLAAWSETLAAMAAVADHPEVREYIGNPGLTAEQLYGLFVSLLRREIDKEAQSLVRVLISNDRLALLPQIYEMFEHLKHAREGVLDANISTAFSLDDAQLKDLVAGLEAKFKSRINAQVTVDKELIGGVKVVIGDEVIDGSVRGRLATMAAALQK